jgi:hypothetical protein
VSRVGATAVASSPESAEPHYYLARSLLLLAQVPEAIESVQEAIRLRTNFSEAHTLHGTALAMLGDNEVKPSCYDVVSAADVFIYVGKLDSVIPAVRKVLRANGLFAFSTEDAEDAPNIVNASPTAGYQLPVAGMSIELTISTSLPRAMVLK